MRCGGLCLGDVSRGVHKTFNYNYGICAGVEECMYRCWGTSGFCVVDSKEFLRCYIRNEEVDYIGRSCEHLRSSYYLICLILIDLHLLSSSVVSPYLDQFLLMFSLSCPGSHLSRSILTLVLGQESLCPSQWISCSHRNSPGLRCIHEHHYGRCS